MKIMIAGLGSIGRRHLRNLQELGERDILLYRTKRATLPDDDLIGLPTETDLRRALEQKPAAVIIANPTAKHLEVAIPAAETGCHILLEKPISGSLDGVSELASTARKSGSRILVGFQFRFHPTLRKAADLLGEEVIGKVISVRSHWGEYLPGWHPWEDHKQGYAARPDLGGGVALTLSHPLDYLHWLVGKVEALWAFSGDNGLGLPVEDNVEIGLKFSSGAMGTVHLDYNQRPSAHTLELIGTRGTLSWNNADGILNLYKVAEKHWQRFPPPKGFERNWMFLDEVKHFLALVRGEAEPICSLEDGRVALELSLSALRSAQNTEMIKFPKG